MAEPQRFVQGSSVRLVIRVSEIATDDPRDVTSVTLVGLTGSDPVSIVFVRTETGHYEHLLDSTGMDPGAYWW